MAQLSQPRTPSPAEPAREPRRESASREMTTAAVWAVGGTTLLAVAARRPDAVGHWLAISAIVPLAIGAVRFFHGLRRSLRD